MMGTLDYMAPEQGGDSHAVDIRADIYSLGATLYKLLTGEVLFHGQKFATPVQKIMALATVPAPDVRAKRRDVPDALAQLLARMLAKDPADRPSTPAEVVKLLTPFVTKKNVPQAKPPVAKPPVSQKPAALASDASFKIEPKPILPKVDSRRRIPLAVLIATGAAAAFVLLAAAIWVIIRDKEGKEVARIQVPEGGSTSVVTGEVGASENLNQRSLAGRWFSGDGTKADDFGDIVLRAAGDGYSGTYTASSNGPPGKLSLKPVGKNQFAGHWTESDNKRRGTLSASLIDGRTLRVAWEDDPQSQRRGMAQGGTSQWIRVDSAASDGNAAPKPRLALRATLAGHSNQVWALAFSPDGDTLASGGMDNTVILWNVAEEKERRTLRGHANMIRGIAISPDGTTIVTASKDKTLKLWDASSGDDLATLSGHTNIVTGVAWSPDGETILSTSDDQTARIWNVDDRVTKFTLKTHKYWVTSPAYSPDRKLAATSAWDHTVKVWNLASGEEARTLEADAPVCIVAFSPHGETILAGCHGGAVRLWDAATGERRWHFNVPQAACAVAFHPGGQVVAVGSFNGEIRLLDVKSGKELAVVKGHQPNVRALAFSPDGAILASAAEENSVKLWDVSGVPLLPRLGTNGFVPMFNQQDLSGWTAMRSATIDWKNEDGTITGRNRSGSPNSAGVLQSQKQYRDFHFRCDVLAGSGAEPALLFRSGGRLVRRERHGYALTNPAPNSPSIAEGWGYGSLYADDFQVLPADCRLAPAAEKDLGIKTGDWFRLEIVAQGEVIEIRVNGKQTVRYTSSDPALNRAGAISLRCHAGTTVAFRNLEIKELTASEPSLATRTPADYARFAKGKWVPAFDEADEIPEMPGVSFADGVITLDDAMFRDNSADAVQATDMIVRARIKGRWGSLSTRCTGGNYTFWMTDGFIGINRNDSAGEGTVLASREFKTNPDEFHEHVFATIGDRLIAFIDGRRVLDTTDDKWRVRGPILIHVHQGKSEMKNIEVMSLDGIDVSELLPERDPLAKAVGLWDTQWTMKVKGQPDKTRKGLMLVAHTELADFYSAMSSAEDGSSSLFVYKYLPESNAIRTWTFFSNGYYDTFDKAIDPETGEQTVPPRPQHGGNIQTGTMKFPDENTAEVHFVTKSPDGQVVAESIGTNKRRDPRQPGPRPSLGADGPAKEVPALDVLSPFAGRWNVEMTIQPAHQGEDGVKQMMKDEIRWQLGGRFLVGEGYTADGKLASVWLWTYDPKTKTYPMTMFQESGDVPVWNNVWDPSKKSLEGIAKDLPTGWAGVGGNRIVDDNRIDAWVTIKDDRGAVMFDMEAIKRRETLPDSP
jgi:WD40 repeat protein